MSVDDHRAKSRPVGMELFDVKPVLVGGDPRDSKNKAWLTRRQHIDAVRYWNRIIAEMRKAGQGSLPQS
jgi:hypothetical protein